MKHNQNKKILIFDDKLSGHNLEYLHHLYTGAVQDKANNYIFALPEGFETKSELRWDKADNIRFHLFKDQPFSPNKIKRSFELSKFVKKIALQHCVDEVFFVSLMSVLPCITFILPKSIKISGIIYLIYLYRWKESNLKLKIEDSIKYLLMSNGKQFKTVFLLNDEIAPIYLNKKFKTKVFRYLPDPFVPLPTTALLDIKSDFNIPTENIIYLHMGAMSARKGTLKILDAIELLEENDLNNKTFIFAGKINPDIKDEFYKKFDEQRKRTQILCFDEFCEYSFLGALCKTADYILLPYENTLQSSGIIGYAAQFKKPVVVPNSKLMGKLVKRNKLGYLLNSNSQNEIAHFIKNNDKMKMFSLQDSEDYLKKNTVEHFNQVIFHSFGNE